MPKERKIRKMWEVVVFYLPQLAVTQHLWYNFFPWTVYLVRRPLISPTFKRWTRTDGIPWSQPPNRNTIMKPKNAP